MRARERSERNGAWSSPANVLLRSLRGDILTEGRGLLRSLVVTLEQYASVLIEQSRKRDSADGSVVPNFKQAIVKTLDHLSSLLVVSYKFENSEEAVSNTVRLVRLLRRYREQQDGVDDRFPFEFIRLLVMELCSCHSHYLWQDLELKSPPHNLTAFIRDRSDSVLDAVFEYSDSDPASSPSACGPTDHTSHSPSNQLGAPPLSPLSTSESESEPEDAGQLRGAVRRESWSSEEDHLDRQGVRGGG